MWRLAVPKKHASSVDAQIGNRVRVRRMLIGMSQERLAELLGLTFQQVQKYEKGTNRVGSGRLLKVSTILGVKITDFFEGTDRPHDTARRSVFDQLAQPEQRQQEKGDTRQEHAAERGLPSHSHALDHRVREIRVEAHAGSEITQAQYS